MWRGVDAARLWAVRGRAVAAGRARLLGLLHMYGGNRWYGAASMCFEGRVWVVEQLLQEERGWNAVWGRCGVPTGGSGAKRCDVGIGVRASTSLQRLVVRA